MLEITLFIFFPTLLKSNLTLCIQEFPKRVLLQTVKTQMKCSITLHFIRVYTVFKGEKDLQTKEYNFFLFITCYPQICTMDYPKFITSNQKEESIGIQRVKIPMVARNLKFV